MPLSPNWRLDGKGIGVRLVPHTDDPEHRICSFEIVSRRPRKEEEEEEEHNPGSIEAKVQPQSRSRIADALSTATKLNVRPRRAR